MPVGSEGSFVEYLGGKDAAADSLATPSTSKETFAKLRDALKAEKDLVVVFGSEIRGAAIKALVDFAPGAKFLCLGDYSNSRGAADMGLYPDLLPGYASVASSTPYHEEWLDEVPAEPGLNLMQMMDSAKSGALKALWVVGSNPVARYNVDPFALNAPFVVVQDMFLTETAATADVVLPAANLYEKAGTVTNTCRRHATRTESRRTGGREKRF